MKVVCFGEPLLRLRSEPGTRLLDRHNINVHLGGAELNVASALVAFGYEVSFVSALPDHALGYEAAAKIRGRGIDISSVIFGDGRLGTYYQIPGSDLRGSEIIYDRDYSAFSRISEKDINVKSALEGADWLHISGITLALGNAPAEAAITLAETAKSSDIPVSFDFNHREKLWARWSLDPSPILKRMVACASLLFGNDFDLIKVLEEPPVRAGRSLKLADRAFETFPHLETIATAYRTVERSHRHRLQAELVTKGARHLSETVILDQVLDRVGGGDAFSAGLIASTLEGSSPSERLNHAFASLILKHGWVGDATRSSWGDIIAFDVNISGDVKR